MFYPTYDTSNLGLNVQFNDTSVGNLISYSWDFGDGSMGSGNSTQHNYNTPGPYNVSLTTIDANGSIYTSTKLILVGPKAISMIINVTAGTANLDVGKVFVYYHNPVDNSINFYKICSQQNGSFVATPYVCPGSYYLFAKPDCYSAYYSTYAPSYYQSSLFWSSATPIFIGNNDTTLNIALVPIILPMTGVGNISGALSEGGKFRSPGSPVPDVEIMLLDMNDQILAFTITDANGNFGFQQLSFGTYKIYAEVAGLTIYPVIVSQGKNILNFDARSLMTGFYFLLLTTEKGQKTTVKLSVIR